MFGCGGHLDQRSETTKLWWHGPLPKLCPVIPTSNQDGRQAKIEKSRDEI
jgi:hypothetical protein